MIHAFFLVVVPVVAVVLSLRFLPKKFELLGMLLIPVLLAIILQPGGGLDTLIWIAPIGILFGILFIKSREYLSKIGDYRIIYWSLFTLFFEIIVLSFMVGIDILDICSTAGAVTGFSYLLAVILFIINFGLKEKKIIWIFFINILFLLTLALFFSFLPSWLAGVDVGDIGCY